MTNNFDNFEMFTEDLDINAIECITSDDFTPEQSQSKNKAEEFESKHFDVVYRKPGVRHLKFKCTKKSAVQLKKSVIRKEAKKCDLCHRTFTTDAKLAKHKNVHNYEKPHKCGLCSETFNVLENLTLHISLHNGQPFRCPQCGKIFSRLASLDGHIKSHFKSEYFVCTHCSDMFHYEISLREHIAKYHPTEGYKMREQREQMITNRRNAKRDPWQCKFCSKVFAKKCLLERHERIHTGVKPYTCDLCDRAFNQKNTLETHRLTHTGDRSYPCQLCPQSFTQNGNLKVHISRCHTAAKQRDQFKCTLCSCSFKKIGTLNTHISRVHPAGAVSNDQEHDFFKVTDVMEQLTQLSRNVPDDVVPSKSIVEHAAWSDTLLNNFPPPPAPPDVESITYSELKLAEHTTNGKITHRHVRQRQRGEQKYYICFYCPKEFRRPSDLIRHIRIHTGEKPFKCEKCDRRFSVKGSYTVHMRIHENDLANFKCTLCEKLFRNRYSLNLHMKQNHLSPSKCESCSLEFDSIESYKLHRRSHHKKERKPVDSEQQIIIKGDDSMDDIRLDLQLQEPVLVLDDNRTTDGPFQAETVQLKTSDVRKHVCDICGQCFKRKSHLMQHVANHMGLKPHQCGHCNKSFSSASLLNRHTLYHYDNKPFKCNKCTMSFRSAYILKRHAYKHSDQRNIMCPYCRSKFKSKISCKQHMKLHKSELLQQLSEQIQSGNLLIDYRPTQLLATDEVVETQQIKPVVHEESRPVTINSNNQISVIENIRLPSESMIVAEPNIGAPAAANNNIDIVVLILADNQEQQTLSFENEAAGSGNLLNVTDIMNNDFIILNTNETIHMLDNQTQHQLVGEANNLETSEINNYSHQQVDEPEISDESSQPTVASRKKRKRNSCPTRDNHICSICEKIFKKSNDLHRHIRIHTGEKPFKCAVCCKSFTLRCTLKSHMKKHESVKKMLPCHICWNAFATKSSLSVHMRIHSGLKPYKCDFCSLTFRTSGQKQKHQEVHVRESQRRGGIDPKLVKTRKEKGKLLPIMELVNACNETVNADKKSVAADVQLDDSVPPTTQHSSNYECPLCDKTFDNFTLRELHVQKHSVSFDCKVCNKSFTKASLLARHSIVHTRQKSFACEICHKSFTQNASLQAHSVLHNSDKQSTSYSCDGCDRKFNFRSNLKAHQKRCTN